MPSRPLQKADPAHVAALLDSTRKGDLYPALREVKRNCAEDGRLVRPLLSHRDTSIRALAVAICGRDPSLHPVLRPFFADPKPSVRLPAVRALVAHGKGREEVLYVPSRGSRDNS